MTLPQLRTGPWRLTDLRDVEPIGLRVFSTFCCGGGSSMGYKLAGFEVLGGVEIDPEMSELYQANLRPQMFFTQAIQDFKLRQDIPDELRQLDVLDGSPPCSVFSTNGNREKDWGKSRKFREGQSEQVLDDLFFHFIDLAKLLRPKMVVAENVKGLILGKARGYVKWIFERFEEAGYDAQLFLLNSARMGLPQKRERTFFIARRKDLAIAPLKLSFSEPGIPVIRALRGLTKEELADGAPLTKMALELWEKVRPGQSFNRVHPKGSWFAHQRLDPALPSRTLIAGTPMYHWSEPRFLSSRELVRVQGFPEDYDFLSQSPNYVLGMSVPPLMMQRVATAVAQSLLI